MWPVCVISSIPWFLVEVNSVYGISIPGAFFKTSSPRLKSVSWKLFWPPFLWRRTHLTQRTMDNIPCPIMQTHWTWCLLGSKRRQVPWTCLCQQFGPSTLRQPSCLKIVPSAPDPHSMKIRIMGVVAKVRHGEHETRQSLFPKLELDSLGPDFQGSRAP